MIAETKEVLDHGFVRLVGRLGNDLTVVRSARVSYDAEWRTGEDAGKDEKLIRYLMKNRHTSPFEHVVFSFDVKCPLFIARQWMRHRTWSYNEISGRYAELPEEYYLPRPEHIGAQATDNKQMRVMNGADRGFAHEAMRLHFLRAFREYRLLLEQGVPRELARSVLPLATYTHFFATVNLHNLLHFLELRLHPHAQWEFRQYAQAILELITPCIPTTIAAWRELQAPTESAA